MLRSTLIGLVVTIGSPAIASAQFWSDDFASPVKGGLGFDDRGVRWAVFDDGGGEDLYASGVFTQAGSTTTEGLVRWTGAGWEQVAAFNGSASNLLVADLGSGPELYVSGGFTDIDGVPFNGLARWDGTLWQDVGGGVTGGIFGLALHDDGSGPAIYASGDFTIAGAGVSVQNVASWDGTSWADVGGGISGPFGGCCTYGGFSWDDGTGPGYYVGTDPGPTGTGAFAQGVAKWNGTEWETLGTGLTDGPFNFAAVFTTWDDGRGEALYIGGDFAVAGGVTSNHVARWNGSFFENLGGGLTGTLFPYGGNGLHVHNSGDGEELWVSGLFTEAGGVPSAYVGRWDGQNWLTTLGGIRGGSFTTGAGFETYDDGSGSALWFSGGYESIGAHESFNVARWQAEAPTLTADLGQISLAAGGTQKMELRAGEGQAFAPYLVVGSLLGSFPGGIPLGAVSIPLLADTYTVLSASGTGPLVNSAGVLDANGAAVTLFSVPPGFAPNLADQKVSHAFVSFAGGFPSFASNAIEVDLLP